MKKCLILLFHFAPKKIGMALCFTLCIMHCAFSQGGVWTWISGDSALSSPGVYGTLGIPSVSNHPPAAYEYSEWKDKQGNFWIYGGTYPSNCDLWKYNPLTNEWTWVKGNGLPNQSAIYGTQGVPGPLNHPGSKSYSAATWTDTTGNLWIFGGNPMINDLWKYDPLTNEWTWLMGDTIMLTSGVHGIQGIPSPSNVPGPRSESCTAWTDSLNNLWLFGGEGVDDAGGWGFLNDLMKYDISTNEWTWMHGSAIRNSPGNYGAKGIPNATNDPCARWTYTKWKDAQNKFWFLGGSNALYLYNDLWKYDWATNIWTWMAGTDTVQDSGIYQTSCTYDVSFRPASKLEHRSAVTDNCGRFWLFGGGNVNGISCNDLWILSPQQLKWNWINGIINQPGNFGSLGVASPLNLPRGRMGAVSWWGNDNRFYLFGGFARNGDLWVYTPDTNCILDCNALALAGFSGPDTICPGGCSSFVNLSINSNSFQWSFPGAIPSSSTDTNPINICYSNPGSYSVQLIAFNTNGNDTLTMTDYITVYPVPPPESITQNGDTLSTTGLAASYQWYYNGSIINGATDYYYVAQESGDYNVIATDPNGCEVEAVINDVLAHAPLAVGYLPLAIYPNPVFETIDVRGLGTNSADEVLIYNVVGEKVFSAVDCKLPIANCQLSSGMYYIEIHTGNKIFRSKFMKQ